MSKYINSLTKILPSVKDLGNGLFRLPDGRRVDTVAGLIYSHGRPVVGRTTGYRVVALGPSVGGQHVLICALATGVIPVDSNGDVLDVNHKDGNVQNNRSSNLEWCTSAENKLHAGALKLLRACGYANDAGHLPAPLSVNDVTDLGGGHLSLRWTSPTGEIVTLAR